MTNIVEFPAGGTLKERVAEEVRVLMTRHHVRQADLAAVLNVKQPQISARLNGRVEFTVSELDLLARYFGVSPVELLGGVMTVPPPGPGVSMATRGYAYPTAA